MVSVIACLAMAIYFEARSEPIAGQLAVAQVIENRVASRHYPSDVCEVVKEGPVYKSGHPKRNMCQFSFWCDGKPETINDNNAWQTALRIAKSVKDIDVSEGATHYHSVDVSPSWRYTMQTTVVIGRHIFYRPIGEGK
jgi:spore germination cell wall hydrolase CwlJ-like protein